MRFRKLPIFGLIEILPCALNADNLCQIETRIENEAKKKDAIFSVKKMYVKNDSLEITLTYDWMVLDDYGPIVENYTKRIREITGDIKSISLNIQINGIIILNLNMKRQELYLNPPPSLRDLFSRLAVKPLWTIGVVKEIERNVMPNYFYEHTQRIVFRDIWPKHSFYSKSRSIEQNILACLTENLKKNLKAESSGRLLDTSDFWTNITFLSIYCERIQMLLDIENPHVQCLTENYKSRISQLQYLGMKRLVDQIVEEVRWCLV